jgi:hypothetical protein
MKPQDQHPLLFTDIVKEVVDQFGEKGKEVIAEAVQFYGKRRGRRMAEKGREQGYDNDLACYLLFGEFDVTEVGNKLKIVRKKPYLEVHMTACFWHSLWKEHGLLDYGKLYCKDIDTAILNGLNSAAGFEVNGNMTAGDTVCRFSYFDWPLTLGILLKYLFNKKKMAVVAQKPWDYHTADLYQALSRVIRERLGEKGAKAIEKGMNRFADRFGKEAKDAIVQLTKTTDFDSP